MLLPIFRACVKGLRAFMYVRCIHRLRDCAYTAICVLMLLCFAYIRMFQGFACMYVCTCIHRLLAPNDEQALTYADVC